MGKIQGWKERNRWIKSGGFTSHGCGPDGKGGDEGAGACTEAKRTPAQPEMPPKSIK